MYSQRWTQIAVTVEVREEIKKRGAKGEKYNDVLRRLLGMTVTAQEPRFVEGAGGKE